MTDLTTPTLDLDLIHVHPHNVRRTAVADDEMVDSIRSIGIAQAVTVMPNPGGCDLHSVCYILGAGHRRCDGARQAGLTEVPVMLRDDLVTEAQQIEFMCVENLHRVDLTAVEEAQAYEQLVLQGMDVAAIAAATGRKPATIKSRLSLNELADTARERLHAGEITLLDAEALLEFADDPETTKSLEAVIGTGNFRWAIEDARRARARREQRAAQIAELEKTGATQVDEVRDGTQKSVLHFRDEALRDPAEHPDCLAYVVPESQWQDPYLVCTDPSTHPETEEPPRVQVISEWEKKQAEREERRQRRATASAVRVEWLRDHFGAMFPTKSHQPLAAAAQAFLPGLLCNNEAVDHVTVIAALGLSAEIDTTVPDFRTREVAVTSFAATLSTAKPTTVLSTFAAYLAALVADELSTDPEWFQTAEDIHQQLVLWDWLKTAGYDLSDVDKEIRTELEVKHTELVAESEAS